MSLFKQLGLIFLVRLSDLPCTFFCSLLVRLLIYPTVCPFRKREDERNLFIHLAEIHCIAGTSAMPGAGDIEVKSNVRFPVILEDVLTKRGETHT